MDTGKVADKVSLVLPHISSEMGQFMADSMGDIGKWHFTIIICLDRKGRVDAAQLLDGQQPGKKYRLGAGIVASQLGKLFSQADHSLPPLCSRLGQYRKGGANGALLLGFPVLYFLAGFVELAGEKSAQLF